MAKQNHAAARVSTKPKTTTQTVRINGVRTKITTRNGKVTTTAAEPLEWELQAAQVRHLRNLPEYVSQFILAADMNAERRGPKARTIALASGMTAGEPDLRIYANGGRLLLIENKIGRGRLSPAQIDRHAALERLGFKVVVLRANSEDDAVNQAVAAVLEFISANSPVENNT